MLGYCKVCQQLKSLRPVTELVGNALGYRPIMHDAPRKHVVCGLPVTAACICEADPCGCVRACWWCARCVDVVTEEQLAPLERCSGHKYAI